MLVARWRRIHIGAAAASKELLEERDESPDRLAVLLRPREAKRAALAIPAPRVRGLRDALTIERLAFAVHIRCCVNVSSPFERA